MDATNPAGRQKLGRTATKQTRVCLEAIELCVIALLAGSPEDLLYVEALLGEPLITHELAHVVTRGIREEHSHTLARANVVLADEPVGTSHGRTARSADQQALVTDDVAAHGERLVIISLHPIVSHILVQHCGHKVVADAFHVVPLQPLVACTGRQIIHTVWLPM